MFKLHNENPSGANIGDCYIRAIATAYGLDYNTVKHGLIKNSKEIGVGSAYFENIISYLKKEGLHANLYQMNKTISVKKCCDTFNKGNYIFFTYNHMVAVKDGNYYDTYDSGLKRVTLVLEVK